MIRLTHLLIRNLRKIRLIHWRVQLIQIQILGASEIDVILTTTCLDNIMLISLPFCIAVEAFPVLVKYSQSRQLVFSLSVNTLHTKVALLVPTTLTLYPY